MTDHEVGRLSAQIEAAQEKIERLDAVMTARVEKLEGKLDEALRILNEARGGWRVLVIVGGAIGAVVALALKLMGAFSGRGQ